MVKWKSAVIALTRRDDTVQAGEKIKSKLIEGDTGAPNKGEASHTVFQQKTPSLNRSIADM
jgi:hypothetical protein